MQSNPQHRLSARSIPDIDDRRLGADRRTHPTTFRSALRWHRRRKSFRRAGEGHNAYVDGLAPRTTVLVLLVVCCSALDAWLTLIHLGDGGREANPVMALVLTAGPTVFLRVKMALSGLGAWLLAAHQQFALARHSLYGLTLGYGILMLYHGLLRVW